jgi:hypothetical protein
LRMSAPLKTLKLPMLSGTMQPSAVATWSSRLSVSRLTGGDASW